MICPYCAEDVSADSQQHQGCRRASDKPFPPLYLHYHAGQGRTEPIVLSVIGFPGHGKTVFLCALFDYLDDHLTYVWRNNFHNLVLDQESLSQLNANRSLLRQGELPHRTDLDFPRPGIFRLTHMPRSAGGNGLPPLEDTTVLIYDPPGEAFQTEDKIGEYASFVRRSSCVLFLIDLTALGTSIAHGMALLLETYVLGMRRIGIKQQSQHLIVVYTKADEMKVSVPEFASLMEREPWLKDYLEEQRPETLSNPDAHFEQLQRVSHVLAEFTWTDLGAAKFVNVAEDWFASISYTAISSLGSAPEPQGVEDQHTDAAEAVPQGEGDDATTPDPDDENGRVKKKLTAEMSPRGVIDPLLYVLAMSVKKPPVVTTPQTPDKWLEKALARLPPWAIPTFVLGAVVLALLILLALLSWTWP